MPMIEIDYPLIAQGAVGLGGAGFFGRLLLSWFRKQGSADTLISERDKFMNDLKEEAKNWEQRHDDLYKIHQENVELIQLLKMQNTMMRMLLINKGISEFELAAIGVIPTKDTKEVNSKESDA